MKRRSGFVSNSSSSSFVVYGIEVDDTIKNQDRILALLGITIPEDEDERWDTLHNLERGLRVLQGSDDGMENGKLVVGADIINGTEDGYIESGEMGIQELDKKIDRLKSLGEVKIYTGQRAC